MNSSHDEPRRIQTGDVLFTLYEELRAQARTIRPWDADRREGWLAACADVLSAVPCRDQRACWAIALSMAVSMVGMPIGFVVQRLLARAEEVIACRR